MSISRVHRLLRIITLLQSGAVMTPNELAAVLGVSRRTVFRDLNMLEAAGIPYYLEPNGGYRIARNFFLPPVSLSIAEVLGLSLLAKTTARQKDKPMMDAGLSAITKLMATVPGPLREACREMMSRISVDLGAHGINGAENAVYNQLQGCIDQGRACRLSYSAPGDRRPQVFDVEPHALHFSVRAWYLFARVPALEQVRIFKLARIDSVEPLPRRFDKPRHDTVKEKLGQAWQLKAEGRVYKVELEFSSTVGTNVAEVKWHESQQHQLLDDGRCLMRFEVDGLGELAWWLCGYADQVTILKPKALRQRVHQLASAAAKHHAP